MRCNLILNDNTILNNVFIKDNKLDNMLRISNLLDDENKLLKNYFNNNPLDKYKDIAKKRGLQILVEKPTFSSWIKYKDIKNIEIIEE